MKSTNYQPDGAAYDLPQSTEAGALLTTIASMHSCARYSLRETDEREIAATEKHLDELLVRAVDDARFALSDATRGGRQLGAADERKRIDEAWGIVLEATLQRLMAIDIEVMGPRKKIPTRAVHRTLMTIHAEILRLRSVLEAGRELTAPTDPKYSRDDEGYIKVNGELVGLAPNRLVAVVDTKVTFR